MLLPGSVFQDLENACRNYRNIILTHSVFISQIFRKQGLECRVNQPHVLPDTKFHFPRLECLRKDCETDLVLFGEPRTRLSNLHTRSNTFGTSQIFPLIMIDSGVQSRHDPKVAQAKIIIPSSSYSDNYLHY